ncbi:GC-rich sequence DNA-binding factor 2 [Cololabis saira]|uniref:GC-rich sequence DNA-binding factor 2 n=1 Tax=Cololabis saira TaxID=129043 RepID=UPI002AD4C886|nr:GC-rich sequence DNA-binding factor 2 [Cololabis saira]
MFNKKPRRNFRQRKNSSSDEDDQQRNNADGDENEKPRTAVNKSAKVAQVRGISCSSRREETPPKSDSSDGEDGDTLEEPREGEERENSDERKKKSTSILSFSHDKEVEESSFKLKRSSDKAVLFHVRKKEAPPAKVTHSKDVGAVPSSSSSTHDSDSEASSQSPHRDDENSGDSADTDDSDSDGRGPGSPSASSDSGSSRSSAKPIFIPSAKQIKAAKKQRHATRTQKEFIPLGRDGQRSAGSTPDHYSRDDEEDRVDDDDDDEDDHEKRIEFAPRLKSIRERIAEKLGGSDDYLSGSDGEEQELWEETQIGKGVKRRPGEQSPSGSECSSYSSSNGRMRDRGRQKKKPTRVKIPKTVSDISVSMVKRRITRKLDSLKEVHRARQAELRRMEGDAENAKSSLELLEESSSESRLKFFRTMTLYIHNLVECLREKVVEINALELDLQTLLCDQMEALLNQRRESVREQAARLQQLSYNTDVQSSSPANGADTQCDTETGIKMEEDFDLPEDTQPSTEEEEQMQKRIADILAKSKGVFSDVQDDFCDVKKILSRFEQWRGSHSESYHNAYISLCLPKLLNPIIRHQLLAWNPLKDVSGDFENFPWFSPVETFCHGHGHEELEHTDRQTLSNIVEKTVVPKMTAFVELVWDPMSQQQSVSLAGVCDRLREDYSIFEGEQSKPVKAFVEAVGRRLRSCVDEDVFIPLYPKKCLEDSSSPQRRFRDQQFWTAVKLLGNMGKWELLLPEAVLMELMLDKLLNRYLMITLCSQTLSSNPVSPHRKIADCLPLSWFKEESECLPQLQMFKNQIVQKVQNICKQQRPEDPNTKSAVIEELKVLSRIRCYDSIMAIAEKYRYEDAIYSHQLLNQETA